MKPVILTFVAYYLPGYKSGGPVRTIANLADHLGDKFDFRIITLDRDSFDEKSHPNIKVNDWNQVGKAKVYYSDPAVLTFNKITRIICETKHDVLYLNSFFRLKFTIFPLLARKLGRIPERPVIIAPRGEFSQGAIAIKSWKKKLFIRIAKAIGLYRSLIWQASSKHEVSAIKEVMGEALATNILVAPNLPSALKQNIYNSARSKITNSKLRVVFLSRISTVKNLDFALQVIEKIKIPLEFNVYGLVCEKDYWSNCKSLLDKLPDNITAKYHGVIPHIEVHNVLKAHDLFFLPTRGENFGHVIYESLAAGTPVLISDQTPWKDLDKHGIGWACKLNSINDFVTIINNYAKMDQTEKEIIGLKAIKYSKRSVSDKIVQQNRNLFLEAINRKFVK